MIKIVAAIIGIAVIIGIFAYADRQPHEKFPEDEKRKDQ